MAVLEIDSAPRCRVPVRFSRHVFWLLWVTVILIAAACLLPQGRRLPQRVRALAAPGAEVLGRGEHL